jgi:hypothetical protein
MNIHPTLLAHAKFKIFKRDLKLIGKHDALEYLHRLWAHCQTKQLGENWGKVSPDYVESIADWDGETGKLFEILTRKFCGKPGWVTVKKGGEVVITAWNEHNEYLINAWQNGRKGGRPTGTGRKPADNQPVIPTGTGRKPAGEAIGVWRGSLESGIGSLESGVGKGEPDALAHLPSVDEVIAFGNGPSGIPEAYCRHYHAKCEEQHRWIKNGRLIDWKKELPRWWAGDRATFKFPESTSGQADAVAQLELEVESEKNPEKRRALWDRLKKLRGEA